MSGNPKNLIVIISVLFIASLACGVFSGGTVEKSPEGSVPEELPTLPAETESIEVQPKASPVETGDTDVEPTMAPEGTASSSTNYDTQFPLPENVQNFMALPQYEAGINFQTDMSLDQVVAFYRAEFVSQGLVERELLSVVEESAFSLVFDGSPNGMAVVIQGVALGPNQTNVNIRYEDT